ncbi:MAG TPA: ABC transporter substrate-binding protein [Kineosporiaceae bacterium]|nr:ABC transporter substrate-binding protein [Kineosporiaceae bacterium]
MGSGERHTGARSVAQGTRPGRASVRRRRSAALLVTALVTIFASVTALASTSHASTSHASSALASTSLASTGAAAADQAKPTKVTFTVGILNDVDSLNPFTGVVAESREIWQTMYDTLTIPSAKNFTPTAGLATKWKSSADGLTWTYTIRSGVKWSDGVALTAQDVAYTFNRLLKGSYEQVNYGTYIANLRTVTAPNKTTVVMKTKTPSPSMLRLPVPILPAHVWSKIGSEKVESYKNEVDAVGSGPFVLAERKAGQSIRLTANPNYWGGAPKIDELVYQVYGGAPALARALQNGEVDFADNLDAEAWRTLRNAPGVKTSAGTYVGFDELAFNTGAALANGTPIGDGNPALKDKKVRQALSYAIDRDTLVKEVLDGNGSSGDSVIPAAYTELHQKPSSVRTFNLAKARRLLTAAGYPVGANGKRKTPGGQPLTLRIYVRQESAPSQQAGRLIQGWFGDLGIPVALRVLTETDLTDQIGQGTYDMFEWGWVVEPDPDHLLSSFTCAKRSFQDGGQVFGSLSDSFYCNPRYDRLYAAQARQIKPGKRAATVRKMQQLLYDDAPYVVLYDYDNLQAHSTRFTGFVAQPAPDGVLLFQFGAWSYLKVEPVSAPSATKPSAAATESDDGGGLKRIVVGAILAVLALAALDQVRRRRRSPRVV